MTDSTSQRRFQFSLRGLLFAIPVIALLMAVSRVGYVQMQRKAATRHRQDFAKMCRLQGYLDDYVEHFGRLPPEKGTFEFSTYVQTPEFRSSELFRNADPQTIDDRETLVIWLDRAPGFMKDTYIVPEDRFTDLDQDGWLEYHYLNARYKNGRVEVFCEETGQWIYSKLRDEGVKIRSD